MNFQSSPSPERLSQAMADVAHREKLDPVKDFHRIRAEAESSLGPDFANDSQRSGCPFFVNVSDFNS
ncbi:MAG TPA: hypothetical protein VN873_05015 [Candidatus Angelobacter sp.]|nr:hypothetical protein [Candidatus Angelobacter sp.]